MEDAVALVETNANPSPNPSPNPNLNPTSNPDPSPNPHQVALVEKALVNVEKDGQLPADGMVNASQLKARLVAIDSAFDEKRYGKLVRL